ncbi:MAG: DEAD/DEAH box helicase [Methylotenera sp.]|nr:MAG: DEAD/DEAH box helicase [Methylotenera sp.]
MNSLSESEIETLAIERLQALGFDYVYAPEIAPDSAKPERASFAEVLLLSRLRNAVARINPTLPAAALDEAIKTIQRISSPELLANNEAFHRLLTEGVNVSYQKDGNMRGDLVWLVDFNNVDNNEFVVANQFTIIENNQNKRPDIILFVNGLPLVVIELKNAADENATIQSAYQQISTYKATIPSLFTYNGFVIVSDGLEAKAGSISAGLSRYMAWKSADGKAEASHLVSQLETLINGMLNKQTLLDLIRHFIVFEKTSKEDPVTKQISISTVKKLAAYHQYYAVNAAVVSTLRAASESSGTAQTPASYGLGDVRSQPKGDRKAGVVWHTQGSGKSLSMVFYTGKIVLALNNPTIVVITDRNDLDDQLFDIFAASSQLLRQEPKQVEDRQQLKELLKVASGGVIFTTIQKFQPEEGNVYETLSERRNIVVIADEAHRTQYGFKAKTVEEKNAAGEVIGQKIVYGFAKYMRDALPFATYLGFTGTPIESTDVNTPAVFGNYVDIYDIAQAVEDGATVRIFYESRLAKVQLSDEGRKLVAELDEELQEDELTDTQKAKARWTQIEALIGSKQRIQNIAKDIVTHFEQRQEVFVGKGMIVSMSRRIAAELYEAIVAIKPEWHSDDLNKGAIKVVMTASSSDGPQLAKHHTSKQQRRNLAERMKDPQDELKLVIVRDMWLTGFDAPSMHTLYIDKPMKGHNLMQAIARVNRVYGDKPAGLVVDYLGIAADLKQALSFYSDAGGKGDPAIAQEQALELMREKLEVVQQLYHNFDYKLYFNSDTSKKLSLILAAEEHVLGLDDGKKRYVNEVTALSQAFAIAIPHDEAMDVKDEVAFFQAVKARLAKFDSTGEGRTDEAIETTIRQVIDQALVSEQVIDVFDAAGIKKPDISILSDEFLMELKNHEHKNIALEVLKKLLNEEIRVREKTNLIQSRSLMEMLQNSIKRYQNKIITATELMDELIKVSKEIVHGDSEAERLKLSPQEFAFYTAVANNDSAKQLMQQDKLRELAVVLLQRVRENASIDWTIKESVRAKLKIIVKRTLRQFGYPPDMEILATETVLKQAELIAGDLYS